MKVFQIILVGGLFCSTYSWSAGAPAPASGGGWGAWLGGAVSTAASTAASSAALVAKGMETYGVMTEITTNRIPKIKKQAGCLSTFDETGTQKDVHCKQDCEKKAVCVLSFLKEAEDSITKLIGSLLGSKERPGVLLELLNGGINVTYKGEAATAAQQKVTATAQYLEGMLKSLNEVLNSLQPAMVKGKDGKEKAMLVIEEDMEISML